MNRFTLDQWQKSQAQRLADIRVPLLPPAPVKLSALVEGLPGQVDCPRCHYNFTIPNTAALPSACPKCGHGSR